MSGAGAKTGSQTLRERLAALQGRPLAPVSARAQTPPPSPDPLLLGGREEETPFGPSYVIERRYPLDYRHGPHPLGALRAVAPALLAALGKDPRLAALPHERLVLLDTETTGLAGGTGTQVFLVGLGYLSTGPEGDETFVVRQYFLRHLREERALLHALGATLADYGALVSFNGKSFDWPLLTTRFIMARMEARVGGRARPHLDLLHPARRVWKHRLPSCSLGNLEQDLFGIRRELDVPGALIPDLYFRYLRDGDPRPLLPVFAHNQADIVTLLALLIHLGHLLEDAPGATFPVALPPLAGADRYGLATLHATLGRPEASIVAFREALADPALSPLLRRTARLALAGALKQARRWDEAVPVWREVIRAEARRKRPDPWASIELAKYHEHIARDYAAAIAIVEAALSLLALRNLTTERDNLHYRLARLQRKVAGIEASRPHDARPTP